MTYEAAETSDSSGYPVNLYTITVGNRVFRYTNNSEDVVLATATYRAVPINNSRIEQQQDSNKLPITITAIRSLDAVQRMIESPPVTIVTVLIQSTHLSDPDRELFVAWQGRINNYEFKESTVELNCDPTYTAIKRTGLRRKFQRQCPHVLYGPICKVQREQHTADGTIESVNGLTITFSSIDTPPNGNPFFGNELVGGYIEFNNQGVAERRVITSQNNLVITIQTTASFLTPGAVVQVTRGCAHSFAVCNNVFDNALNYGGFPYSPTNGRNPFATHSPLF